MNFWVRIAGITGLLAVLAGTFGAHGLESRLEPDLLEIFETGVRYHFYHALALLAAAFWTAKYSKLSRVCWAWLTGIIIFSGSLYILAISGMRWLGMITPIGGVAFMVGWGLLLFAKFED